MSQYWTWRNIKKIVLKNPLTHIRRFNDWYSPRPEPVIAVGFDGLLCNTRPFIDLHSNWVVEPPVSGSITFLLQLIAVPDIRVAIFDGRSNTRRGRRAMKNWLSHWAAAHFLHSLPQANIPSEDSKRVIQLHDTLSHWVNAGYLTSEKQKELKLPTVDSGEHVRAGVWLANQIEWPKRHPRARVTIDARSIQFNGGFPSIDEIIQFRIWNQRQTPL